MKYCRECSDLYHIEWPKVILAIPNGITNRCDYCGKTNLVMETDNKCDVCIDGRISFWKGIVGSLKENTQIFCRYCKEMPEYYKKKPEPVVHEAKTYLQEFRELIDDYISQYTNEIAGHVNVLRTDPVMFMNRNIQIHSCQKRIKLLKRLREGIKYND